MRKLTKHMSKNKIIALNHFPVYPPITGGRARIYYLMKNLSEYYDVEILSLDNFIKKKQNKIIVNKVKTFKLSKNFYETTIPEHVLSYLLKLIFSWKLKVFDVDALVSLVGKLNNKFKGILERKLDTNTTLFLEHPFLSVTLGKKYLGEIETTIYDAHNVEFLLKKQIIYKLKKLSVGVIYKVEKFACEISDIIFTTSEEDKQAFVNIYDIPEEKIIVIPNGVDCKSLEVSMSKESAKKYLRIDDRKITILFVGSGHPPNIEAAFYIIKELAPRLKDKIFVFVGEVCDAIKSINNIPENVKLLGVVDSKTKNIALKASDIALNPVISGSGTNVKMLEYMAAGIPTITTPIGARGLDVENWKHLIIVERYRFFETLENISENPELCEHIGKNAKKLIKNKYDWGAISQKVLKSIKQQRYHD